MTATRNTIGSRTGQVFYRRARKLIPGGTQLLSNRPEMFLVAQAVGRRIVDQGTSGSIIQTSSIYGLGSGLNNSQPSDKIHSCHATRNIRVVQFQWVSPN